MWPKLKSAIIFGSIGLVLVLLYVYFFSGEKAPENNLVSSQTPIVPNSNANTPVEATAPDKDFLPLLLNVKNIRLNDAIFSDPAFTALVDSSITLTPEGNEGRPNPFAPLGAENATSSQTSSTQTTQKPNTQTN